MTSVPTEEDESVSMDLQQRTPQYCGGLAGVLFVIGVLGVGMLTTIITLTLYAAKSAERVTPEFLR